LNKNKNDVLTFMSKISAYAILFCLLLLLGLISACGAEPKAEAIPQAAPIGAPQVLELPVGERVLFTDNFADYAVDGDKDGLFEAVVIDVEVNILEAGEYNLGASLSVVDDGGITKGIDGIQRWLSLEEGVQIVPMTFEGKYIFLSEEDGPYQLSDLWVTHVQNPTPIQLRENLIDSREVPYITDAYSYKLFQGP